MRTTLGTILPILLLAGCPSKTPPGAEARPELERPASPTPASDGPESPVAGGPSDGDECVEQCMHASMAEARSAEAIRADCEASCGMGAPAPVSTGGELSLMGGKRVRATGVLKTGDYPTKGSGAYVELADGAKLWVDDDGVPEGWDRWLDRPIAVVGTLGQGPTSGGQRIRIPFLENPEEPVGAGEIDPPASGPGLLPGPGGAPL